MSIISISFFVFVGIFLIIYYAVKEKYQWIILLLMSIIFYLSNAGKYIGWILGTVLIDYIFAFEIERISKNASGNKYRKLFFVTSVLVTLSPLFLLKYVIKNSMLIPLGISFYTLQLLGYIIDVYRGKIKAERNIFKFMLFAIYFPHIVQGPIARYDDLSDDLFVGHSFDEKNVTNGFMLALYGIFLKLVLADRAAIFVNTVYADFYQFSGVYILIAGILYSIQLYTDFMGCVCISRGISQMFGVCLMENFDHPYFSVSIKDFWRRWHISLSSWLRDYVYIPLGGNRKGTFRKYSNLMITFIVSGIWHGAGLQYIFWGLLHGTYQVVGDVTLNLRERIKTSIQIKDTFIEGVIQRVVTFFFVMNAWIVFRSESLLSALRMLYHMYADFILTLQKENMIFTVGLDGKEWIVLIIGIGILWLVSCLQTGNNIRTKILSFHVVARYAIYIIVICGILVFGKYGSGYDSSSFIYGGF